MSVTITQIPLEVAVRGQQSSNAVVTQIAVEYAFARDPNEPIAIPDSSLNQWAIQRFDMKPRKEETA